MSRSDGLGTPPVCRQQRRLERASAARLAALVRDDGRLIERTLPYSERVGACRGFWMTTINGRETPSTELVHWAARGWIVRTSISHHPEMRRTMHRLTDAGERAVAGVSNRLTPPA